MNKRIIQLITEADTHAWSVAEKYVTGDGCNDGEVNYLWEDAFRQKFAELIVRKCADIALEQKKWVEDQEVFNFQDEQWNRARIQQSQHIADKVKQHFGVEE